MLLAAEATVGARGREADGIETPTTTIVTVSRFTPLGTKENLALDLGTQII